MIKNKQGGSIFGKYANIAMETLESDITIMLCDDDALTPDYLEYLNHYYTLKPRNSSTVILKYYFMILQKKIILKVKKLLILLIEVVHFI
jgi:hypothetical protein